MRISDWSSDVCSSDLDLDPGDAEGASQGMADPPPARRVAYSRARLSPRARRPDRRQSGPAHRGGYQEAYRTLRPARRRAAARAHAAGHFHRRSEEHTSELQSLMRISYAVFCLKKKHTKMRIKLIR